MGTKFLEVLSRLTSPGGAKAYKGDPVDFLKDLSAEERQVLLGGDPDRLRAFVQSGAARRLAAFLAGLASDPAALDAYLADKDGAMQDAGLSQDQAEAVRRGDPREIARLLQALGPPGDPIVIGGRDGGG